MKQPVFVRTVVSGLSTSSDRYATIGSGTGWAVDASTPRTIAPEDGELSALKVRLGTAVTTGTYDFTILVNGSPTTMTVQFSNDGQTVKTYTGAPIPVTAGQTIVMLCHPAGTPTALTSTTVGFSLVYTPTASTKGVIVTGHAGSASNIFLLPGCFSSSGTESNVQVVAPTNGTISKIYLNRSTAPGAGTSAAYTLRLNGSDTTLTTSVADSATTNNATSSVSVTAGQLISVGVVNSGGASSAGTVSFDWEPSTADECVVFGAALTTTLADGADTYVPLGISGQATEADAQMPSPSAFTAKKLYARVRTAPSAGKNRVQHFRVNGASVNQTCTIADAATTAQDTTNTDVVATGDLIDLLSIPSGTPAAANSFLWSLVTVQTPVTGGPPGMLLLGVG